MIAAEPGGLQRAATPQLRGLELQLGLGADRRHVRTQLHAFAEFPVPIVQTLVQIRNVQTRILIMSWMTKNSRGGTKKSAR
jgi:hypothetical protein